MARFTIQRGLERHGDSFSIYWNFPLLIIVNGAFGGKLLQKHVTSFTHFRNFVDFARSVRVVVTDP